MTCIKKGVSELAFNRPRSSIMEVKSALPVPLFRLFLVSSLYVFLIVPVICFCNI